MLWTGDIDFTFGDVFTRSFPPNRASPESICRQMLAARLISIRERDRLYAFFRNHSSLSTRRS